MSILLVPSLHNMAKSQHSLEKLTQNDKQSVKQVES